jgi:non-heme chloroperoxidase
MPFIQTADRTSLFVTDWGSGPPVVFTHAWGLRSDQWTYQIPALAEAGLRCVLYDRRSHGRSDRPATDTLADDLAAVIGPDVSPRQRGADRREGSGGDN